MKGIDPDLDRIDRQGRVLSRSGLCIHAEKAEHRE